MDVHVKMVGNMTRMLMLFKKIFCLQIIELVENLINIKITSGKSVIKHLQIGLTIQLFTRLYAGKLVHYG